MASTARENILKKIKQALEKPVPVPFPHNEPQRNLFTEPEQENELLFAENFTRLQGRFSFCTSGKELVQQLQALMAAREWTKVYCRETALQHMLSDNGFSTVYTTDVAGCDVAITGCESLVARTGSMVMSSAQESGRTVSVYAPVHICIAYTSQLVYDIADSLAQVQVNYGKQFPSMVTVATGPSRTADIEKTLVVGVHGPKEVFCFLVDS